MRILRHRHTLAFLTLLALAMQGIMALAHTHAHAGLTARLVSAVARADAPLATRAMTHGLCRADAKRPCPAPARHDDRDCPICWSMSLAGTAVLAAPPPAPAPDVPKWTPAPVLSVALRLGASGVHFQARAPPRFLA